MKILITNDDGIHADGLWALYAYFSKAHSVTVIAPDREKSAASHAITLREPIRTQCRALKDGCTGFAVTGTPADCIKLGINEILAVKPDLVVAGINPGANVGVNINYSGTVAAAREAALYGLPAIAVAIAGRETDNYADTARFAGRLAEKMLQHPLPRGTFLNVNVPNLPMSEIIGVRICNQEISLFGEYFDKRTDPRNRVYYWHGCDTQTADQNPESDVTALCNRYIAITPLKSDMTDYTILENLRGWGIEADR